MKKLFYLTILTVLFVSGISAKSHFANSLARVQTQSEMTISSVVDSSLSLTGVESAQGLVDVTNDQRMGNTFVFNGAGENVSVHLTVSMDYSAAEPDLISGNSIVNGTWTLTVYKNDVYFGVMYGSVFGGQINWSAGGDNNISRTTKAKLNILGGMDGYADGVPMISDYTLSFTSLISKGEKAMVEGDLLLPL